MFLFRPDHVHATCRSQRNIANTYRHVLAYRYWRHVVHSKVSRDALRNIRAVQKAAVAVIAGCAGFALLSRIANGRLLPTVSVPTVLAIASAAILVKLAGHRLEQLFYVNFERNPVI